MKTKIFRGLTVVCSIVLAASIAAGTIMETYKSALDDTLGTKSQETHYEKLNDDDKSNPWNFEGKFKSAVAAVNGYKEFAIRQAQETMVLLKNENNALPLTGTKVTLMGLRSYTPVYGNSGGSIADKTTIDAGNNIRSEFEEEGFELNPNMTAAYKAYCDTLTWGGQGFGATPPEYKEITTTTAVSELSPSELATWKSDYNSLYSSYNDAAIVVIGRPGGESKEYRMGQNDECTTGNVTGLSDKERAIIKEAEDNFSKVIVLVNSTVTMEIEELKNDPKISGILWIGYPGCYGFTAVAQILKGEISPSAHLGDIYAANNAAAPSNQSVGDVAPWVNASEFEAGANVNSYVVEAEGIYQGYRYYETRYADIVSGNTKAATASKGTYVASDGKLATVDGTWDYKNEVVYPFGYGLSYTTFKEELKGVHISSDHKTAEVTVSVENTGSVAGKHVVQLYAQTPYTQYDEDNGVEKSAVQLVDFEKTATLNAGAKEEVTLYVDMANLASYDYQNAKTYITDAGTYYFAIGSDSHDALNNILAKDGKSGMVDTLGNSAAGDTSKVYTWNWDQLDKGTFSVSETGVSITNRLSDGDYSMDLNSFMPNTVTYMSRQDWNGTFPKTYSGLSASGRLKTLLGNDFIDLKTTDDTSDIKFGDTSVTYRLADLKGADWSDERWDELANKVSVQEFLDFASHAFHHIQEIKSVDYDGNNADDGPGGSDTHAFNEGSYQGVKFTDFDDPAVAVTTTDASGKTTTKYKGTRVTVSQQNIAYSFNKELAFENGEIILGETSLILNLPIMIGPGVNLHRNGINGRGGEYFSEDPVLSGFIGSAIVQGAQSKGCLVNVKHAAFNDQEINRSGVAVFENEQKARELELRNLEKIFTGKGKPSKWVNDEKYDNVYKIGALGVMTSYNRIGAVASSANYGMMVDILRNEWGFHGYNVTDFTGVSLKAAPKESILAGTTAFCGFGTPSLSYWDPEVLVKDHDMAAAIHQNIKYILYSLGQSNALNGTNSSYRAVQVQLNTWWRTMYKSIIITSAILTGGCALAAVVFTLLEKKKEN